MMRRSPGDFPPQGYHLVAYTVSMPNLTEVLGDICRGKDTCIRQGEPGRRCQVDEVYQMPWLTWRTEGMIHNNSNWLRVEGGEEELECPLPLEPHLQELLSGRRHFLLEQEWRTTIHKLQCPMTKNLLPCKMQNGYCGMLDR